MRQLENYSDYEIYEDGRVYSRRLGRDLKQSNRNRGYLQVNLVSDDGVSKTFRSHKLVALAYLPNPENKATVTHIDGVKTNNNVANLEWATYFENHEHRPEITLAT
jgi:hypothetical protein